MLHESMLYNVCIYIYVHMYMRVTCYELCIISSMYVLYYVLQVISFDLHAMSLYLKLYYMIQVRLYVLCHDLCLER